MQPGWAVPCSTQRRCLCSVNASKGTPDAPPDPQRASDGLQRPRRRPAAAAAASPLPSLPSPPPSPQAKPGLGKQQLAQILRAVGQQVMDHGGVVTDIRSYGERRLAYDIRQPGARYGEVGAALAPLLAAAMRVLCLRRSCYLRQALEEQGRWLCEAHPAARLPSSSVNPAAPAPVFDCPTPHSLPAPPAPHPALLCRPPCGRSTLRPRPPPCKSWTTRCGWMSACCGEAPHPSALAAVGLQPMPPELVHIAIACFIALLFQQLASSLCASPSDPLSGPFLETPAAVCRWMVLKRRPYGPLPTPYQVARAAEHVAAPLARQQQQQQQAAAAADATR